MDDENADMCIKSINVDIFMCATDFRINPCALAKCVKIKISLFPPKMVYFRRFKDLSI